MAWFVFKIVVYLWPHAAYGSSLSARSHKPRIVGANPTARYYGEFVMFWEA